jgi:peroxiredoxin Q/BCP
MKIGDKAPVFVLKDQNGKDVKLDGFNGSWVVLYFYPKDDTAGCTMEAKDFTFLAQKFKEQGAVVLGISPDSCESHAKFQDKHKLNVMLLSDPYKKAIDPYRVWGKKSFMGKSYEGVTRSTFLLDKKGNLTFEWRDVKADGHAMEVLNKLKSLVMQAPK